MDLLDENGTTDRPIGRVGCRSFCIPGLRFDRQANTKAKGNEITATSEITIQAMAMERKRRFQSKTSGLFEVISARLVQGVNSMPIEAATQEPITSDFQQRYVQVCSNKATTPIKPTQHTNSSKNQFALLSSTDAMNGEVIVRSAEFDWGRAAFL